MAVFSLIFLTIFSKKPRFGATNPNTSYEDTGYRNTGIYFHPNKHSTWLYKGEGSRLGQLNEAG